MRLIALIIVVAALALESGPMRAEDIKVNKWPTDVPCEAVKMPNAQEDLRQGHSRGARLGSEVWRQMRVTPRP